MSFTSETSAKVLQAFFVQFIQNDIEKVVKYFFVLYLCPLNKNHISIPFCIIPRSNGIACKIILKTFDNASITSPKVAL